MTLYTVVVCPECTYARVVLRQPERTTCGRCQTSKQFQKLRHYYQTKDKRAAARVRGEVQAGVNNLDAAFEDAFERGVIAQDVDATISDDEYLREKGADIEAIEAAKERAEQSQHRSKSKQALMHEAISDHGETRESVIEFAAEHDISEEWAGDYLDKALANGGVTGGRNGPFRLL